MFDHKRTLRDAFYPKLGVVLGSTHIASDIVPLVLALLDVTVRVQKACYAMESAHRDFRFLQSTSAIEDPEEAEAAAAESAKSRLKAISDTLKHHTLLHGFNKSLLRSDWPNNDAAICFRREEPRLASSIISASTTNSSVGAKEPTQRYHSPRKRPRDPSDDLFCPSSPKKSRSVK